MPLETRRPARTPRQSPVGVVALATLLAVACGDDAGSDDPGTARWLVQTTVEGPEGRTSYFHALETLEDVGVLSTALAVEQPGSARLFYQGPSGIFLGAAENPQVTRYAPGVPLAPVPEDTISFLNAGFPFLPFGNTFVAPDRAFLLEGNVGVGVVWDPAALEIVVPDVDLTSLEKRGFELTVNPGVVRGGDLLVPLQYTNVFTLQTFDGVAVGVLDVDDASLSATTPVLEDERCVGGNTEIARTEDGTVLVAADGFLGLVNLLDPSAPPSCLLRIPAGDGPPAFDPDYLLPFPDLLGGRQGLGLVYAGGGIAFVSALYADRLENDPATDLFDALSESVLRWWRVDLAAETATELDLPFHSLRSTVGFVTGGRVFLSTPQAGLSGGTGLWEVDAETGAVREVLTARGRIDAFHALESE